MTDSSHSAPGRRVIAIVGGGFSGVAVAIGLLRAPPAEVVTLVLVEPRAELGAGVAYATRDYPYPLNVAAGQMSLDPAAPADFVEFARSTGIHAGPGDYLPRQVYGEYLRARLGAARHAAPAHVEFRVRRATVLQIRGLAAGRFGLWLDDGSHLHADDVVLAIGNAPPSLPPGLESLTGAPGYVRDPWSLGSLANSGVESVLLIGSGLTMIDAALRLAAIRPRLRHIHVLSRHGWLPQPQATGLPALQPDVAAALAPARGSLRGITRALRTLARDAGARGGDWREVIGLARPLLPQLWHSLDAAQRARFLRHARTPWDVHRHRVPPGPLAAVRNLERLGVLELHAGRPTGAREIDGAIEVGWRPRGAAKPRALSVDRVINCTGPGAPSATDDPLIQSLLGSGLARRDAAGFGLALAPDGRLLDGSGAPVDRLWYVGPWLRARDLEATAVPELRRHAATLAAHLAAGATLRAADG